MPTFNGTNLADTIATYGLSSGVSADPAGTRPGALVDIIYGMGGSDYIDAGGGNDFIYSGSGDDTAYGGAGDDFFDDYTASSFGGNDTFYGGAGNDILWGWTGYDKLYGEDGNDTLYGEADSDVLDGGTGADAMYGGTGSDTYYVDNVGDTVEDVSDYGYDTVYAGVTFTLGAYIETLYLTGRSAISGTGNALGNSLYGNDAANILSGLAGSDDLYGRGGNDTLFGGDGNDYLYGDGGNDTLYGDAGDDYLSGGDGDDTLVGGDGNDQLNGDAGNDRLEGGVGNDTYTYVSAGDTIVEIAGGGTDTVWAETSWTLADNLENLRLSWGAEGGTGTGNALANVITADAYDVTLIGMAGNDTLVGYYGDDFLDGGGGTDSMNGGEGVDTVLYTINTTSVKVDLTAGLVSFPGFTWPTEKLVSIENAITGSGNDTLIGSSVGNAFTGGAGDDSFDGRGGTDSFDGGLGSDTVLYTTNTTSVRVDLTAGLVTFPGQTWAGEKLVSIENAVTGAGADTLIGNSVANSLRGGAGIDVLQGGAGVDILIGGTGNDTFRFVGAADSTPTSRDIIRAGDGAVAFEKPGAVLGDRIDLSAFDAVTTKAGIQDFVFGTTTGIGRLWAINSGANTLICGNTDADAAIEFQCLIEDGATLASAYTAADFIF